MADTPGRMSDEEYLRLGLDLLFSNYVDQDPVDDLKTITKYFEYVSQRIDYEHIHIDVPLEFLNHFESVCLLLRDRLRLYPESVQTQVDIILREENLARTFAVLATLSERDLRRMARQHSALSLAMFRIIAAFTRVAAVEGENRRTVTPQALFDAKIALSRLAQIVKYAASIELVDYDTGADELKDHYDPSLIEKARLLALINALKVQLGEIRDESVKLRLLEQVDRLEEEVRKTRPRWGRIIAGLFILFSFVADLHEISPSTYDGIYRTMQAIISTLHEEGSVEHHRKRSILPDREAHLAILPPSVRTEDDEEA